jgi:phenylacetate-CoA ligase
MDSILLGRKDLEDLRYTAETAFKTTEFWKEKFSDVDIDELKPETLASLTDKVFIEPHNLHERERVWPTYIKGLEVFHVFTRTSGTTGMPKRIPITEDDIERAGEQMKAWVDEYLETNKVASFLPPLPSASGFYVLGAIRNLRPKIAYHGLPIQYLRDRDLLIKELRETNATAIFALTTTAYKLGLILPESIKEDIQLIGVGAETLTQEVANAILNNFPNAIIVDTYASSEEGLTGYRVIKKNKVEPFTFPESLIVLKENEDPEYKDYYEMYITKIMKEGELTGLPIFNYKIGDIARVVDGKVMNIIRVKDVISLGGAKLHIDQVMDIVHRYPFLVDFVIIYHPLSPDNPKPKAIIKVGYVGEKPAGIEDEIRGLIYEANNPVRYEVEEAKSSELIVEAVPAEKVREGLPQKPGKTKRIFIVGRDI